MADEYGCVLKPEVGMKVIDDFTHEVCTITRVERDKFGNVGVWVDAKQSPDDDGGRFPWEISEVPDGG